MPTLEAWGTFVSWPLHECKANTQTINKQIEAFHCIAFAPRLCVKVCRIQEWICIHAFREDEYHLHGKAAGEDSCLELTRKRPFLLGFGRESGKQHKMEAMKEGTYLPNFKAETNSSGKVRCGKPLPHIHMLPQNCVRPWISPLQRIWALRESPIGWGSDFLAEWLTTVGSTWGKSSAREQSERKISWTVATSLLGWMASPLCPVCAWGQNLRPERGPGNRDKGETVWGSQFISLKSVSVLLVECNLFPGSSMPPAEHNSALPSSRAPWRQSCFPQAVPG